MNRAVLYATHVIEAIAQIQRLVAKNPAILDDQETGRPAIERLLMTLSDATGYLPDDLKAKHPEIPWRKIRKFRNVLAHFYLGIDPTIMTGIIEKDLPALKAAVEVILIELQRQGEHPSGR